MLPKIVDSSASNFVVKMQQVKVVAFWTSKKPRKFVKTNGANYQLWFDEFSNSTVFEKFVKTNFPNLSMVFETFEYSYIYDIWIICTCEYNLRSKAVEDSPMASNQGSHCSLCTFSAYFLPTLRIPLSLKIFVMGTCFPRRHDYKGMNHWKIRFMNKLTANLTNYLVNTAKVLEKVLDTTDNEITFRTDNDISHITWLSIRFETQWFPVM